MLYHHVASSQGWTLLFHDHVEASDLWTRLVQAAPGPVALCLMPDHIHVLARVDVSRPLRRAMGHYTQWRNMRRGEVGPAFGPLAPVDRVKQGQKAWRVERYVHLNPCRARLTDSPLRWPWCSYREAVGLCLAPARVRARSPQRYHQRTVDDTTVDGYPLPTSPSVDLADPRLALPALRDAVSSLTRTPLERMGCDKRARTLLVRSARVLTTASCTEIARFAGVSRATAYRVPAVGGPEVRLVERVVGDPRFRPLGELDLAALYQWLERKRRRRSPRDETPWAKGTR